MRSASPTLVESTRLDLAPIEEDRGRAGYGGGTDPGPWRSARRCPAWVTADEAEQPGLRVGVVGHWHSGAVLSGRSDDVLQRFHPGQQQGAGPRVEAVVLTGRPGQVPLVHEHVRGVELVDRPVHRKRTNVLVGQG